MALLTLALLTLGFWLGSRQGLLLAFIVTLGINVYVFILGDKRVRSLYQAKLIEGQDSWGILDTLRLQSRQLRMARPRCYIMPMQTPTAFALSPTGKAGAIYISDGLINEFNPTELEAVLVFLLLQLRRKDTVSLQVGSHLAELIMGPARTIDAGLSSISRRITKRPLFLMSSLLGPIAALIVLLSVRRRSFLDCDQEAARIMQNPELVATVLWKLRSRASTSPFRAPLSVAHLFVVNPIILRGWSRFFPAQPSVQARINNLVGRFPL